MALTEGRRAQLFVPEETEEIEKSDKLNLLILSEKWKHVSYNIEHVYSVNGFILKI